MSSKRPLRILHLEDEPDFSELVRSLLQKDGFDFELRAVASRADFAAALTGEAFDVILADYLLPDFNGLEALELARRQTPGIPFLLVSGTIGEEAAIESLRAGATDYVLKLWPERLAPAVRRAVQEAEERRRRREAETELVRREKYFRALTENALDILTVLNAEGLYLYNSRSLKTVLGYDPQELVGKSPFDLVHPEDLSRTRQAFRQALEQPERTVTLDFRFRHQDGSWRHLEAVGQNLLKDPDVAGVIINSRDVSDRKRLEEQLRQAQKMEAIGQLAGGVAHDFNNILTVIHGHASLLQAGGLLPGPAARSAQQITQAAERAAALTRQLLTFSRRQVMQPRRLDLGELVTNMAKMLGRLLGEQIVLRLDCATSTALVLADATMMEQVLLNLVLNARDAMPKGGLLTISLKTEEREVLKAGAHPEARRGRFACLSVTDNGCGIPPENLPRIFEPFFTTKEVGKGTGLGLATVYGILKQHQGWAEATSELGKGSSFRVFVPCCDPAPESQELAPAETTVRGGTETILVVEDEAAVRELVCALLSGYGYKVVQAQSGVEALEVWKNCRNRVDLLLTDLVMPDRMNGRELAEKLWLDRPNLKVIFTSGYSADVVGRDFVLQSGLNYLQKPYHPHKLALAVRDCLDARN